MMYFLSGGISLAPSTFEHVLAVAVEDSIYASSLVLNDPLEQKGEHQVRRILGNIGKAGIALLISPIEPLVREENGATWRNVNHHPFDGTTTDSFSGSSLHLSFTGYDLPVDTNNIGARDCEVYFLESRLTLCDRGEWVADLDILRAMERSSLVSLKPYAAETCASHDTSTWSPDSLVSIDSWTEFLDPPIRVGVMRAKENWIARLVHLISSYDKCLTITLQASGCLCWHTNEIIDCCCTIVFGVLGMSEGDSHCHHQGGRDDSYCLLILSIKSRIGKSNQLEALFIESFRTIF